MSSRTSRTVEPGESGHRNFEGEGRVEQFVSAQPEALAGATFKSIDGHISTRARVEGLELRSRDDCTSPRSGREGDMRVGVCGRARRLLL